MLIPWLRKTVIDELRPLLNYNIPNTTHRYFQKIVLITNSINLEYTLAMWENTHQTIQFLLMDAFTETDSSLTLQMKRLQIQCFNLYANILSYSELEGSEEVNSTFSIILTEEKKMLESISWCIKPIYARKTLNLSINLCVLEITDSFVQCLCKAYHDDYELDTVVRFENSTVKWYKQISFADRYASQYFML